MADDLEPDSSKTFRNPRLAGMVSLIKFAIEWSEPDARVSFLAVSSSVKEISTALASAACLRVKGIFL